MEKYILLLKMELMKWLRVEEKIEAAFKEGFGMALDTDPILCKKQRVNPVDLQVAINKTRTWRSSEEAWQNSDAQEPFEGGSYVRR